MKISLSPNFVAFSEYMNFTRINFHLMSPWDQTNLGFPIFFSVCCSWKKNHSKYLLKETVDSEFVLWWFHLMCSLLNNQAIKTWRQKKKHFLLILLPKSAFSWHFIKNFHPFWLTPRMLYWRSSWSIKWAGRAALLDLAQPHTLCKQNFKLSWKHKHG